MDEIESVRWMVAREGHKWAQWHLARRGSDRTLCGCLIEPRQAVPYQSTAMWADPALADCVKCCEVHRAE